MRATRKVSKSVVAAIVGATALLGSQGALAQDQCAAWQAAKVRWEDTMKTQGRKWGEYIKPGSGATFDEKLNAIYYDGQWVFQQIGDYLGEASPWKEYAEYARSVYVDQYLAPNNWSSQGYRRFSHGIYNDWKRGGVSTAEQVKLLRDRPAFSNLIEFRDQYLGNGQSMSREVAYALQSNVLAERAGHARAMEGDKSRVATFVDWTEQHFTQWKTGQFTATDIAKSDTRFAPFMAALSMHALIELIEWEEANGRDPNQLFPARTWSSLEVMMVDFLKWQHSQATIRSGSRAGQRLWQQRDGYYAFVYQDRGEGESVDPAFDLNQLIAYPYAWMATRLARAGRAAEAQSLMTIADQLFIGGVYKAWLEGNGKLFNQSYRLSPLYMALRAPSNLGLCAKARPLPPKSVRVE